MDNVEVLEIDQVAWSLLIIGDLDPYTQPAVTPPGLLPTGSAKSHSLDSYIAASPEAFRPVLHHLRDFLRQALPDAEEMTAYNMPGFRLRGTVVASYAAFSKQVGVYFLAPAVSDHAAEIAAAGLRASKTGLTFPPRKPVPDDLVIRLARTARKHVDD